MKKLVLAALAALMLSGSLAWASAYVGDGTTNQPAMYHTYGGGY